MIKCIVNCVLQMLSEGTVSGPADIISVFSFSPHIKQVEGNYSHCISHPPSKFQQTGSQLWWCVHSILDVPPKENMKGLRSGEQGGQVIGPPLPTHVSGNLQFKKSITSLWKCEGAASC
jgi:hypothetical protein